MRELTGTPDVEGVWACVDGPTMGMPESVAEPHGRQVAFSRPTLVLARWTRGPAGRMRSEDGDPGSQWLWVEGQAAATAAFDWAGRGADGPPAVDGFEFEPFVDGVSYRCAQDPRLVVFRDGDSGWRVGYLAD